MRAIPIAVVIALSSSAAFAADAPPSMAKTTMVRGTIEKLDAKTLTIKTDSGTEVTAAINGSSRFAAVESRSFSQIKPDYFIGVTAVPGKDGHLSAEEIHIIPISGIGEGQYPWDHHPSGAKPAGTMTMGSMTNGTVSAPKAAPMMGGSMTNGTVQAGGAAWQLTVSYRGAGMVDGKCAGLAVPGKPGCTGTSIVDVTPQTPIVAILPTRREDVKPGLAVVAAVNTDASGQMVVGSATVERHGAKPEF